MNHTSVVGVVIGGGNSSRMGTDKSLLQYHHLPQRYYLYQLLQHYCGSVFLSCNERQIQDIAPGYNYIVDHPVYQQLGPLSGVCSVGLAMPGKSLLVLGCDYPLLSHTEIEALLEHSTEGKSVAFSNAAGFVEPLVALLQPHDLQRLLQHHAAYQGSLRRFLEQNDVLIAAHPNPEVLSSVDTPADFERIKLKLTRALNFDTMPGESITQTPIVRVSRTEALPIDDFVACEEPLEIRVRHGLAEQPIVQSVSVTMRTPGHDDELAAGFLFTEGILQQAEQIAAWTAPEGQNIISATLHDSVRVDLKKLDRHFYTTSSCGVCGKASIAAIHTIERGKQDEDNLQLPAEFFYQLPALLREQQAVFASTGGLHASALFDLDGKLLLLREDVGRHNALDKLIGRCFLDKKTPLHQHVLLLSGRASFELIQKAVAAGIKIVAAVGAPSSLAVALAQDCGITLLGFLSQQRFNIYSGKQRIKT